MTESPTRATYRTVYLDGIKYPADQVTPVQLARYPGKNTIGDYTRDSDDVLSALILYSFRGGGQKLDVIEGADDERFWDSTLNTEYPGQLSLQDKKSVYPGPNTDGAKPVCDYNDLFYAAFGTKLMKWNATTKAWVSGSTDDLSSQPVADGFEWAGSVYIPLGSNGYDVFDGTNIVNSTDIAPISFTIWDAKLLGLDINGKLCTLTEPGGSWEIPDSTQVGRLMTIPTGMKPRGLELYYNQAGEPTVHILTNQRVFSYDPDGKMLMPTQMLFPPHPDNAQGFSAWRSESLYISAGVGVYEYNGQTISPVGLDRNDGLPAIYRGNIVDLTPEHNGLLALLQGATTTADPDSELWDEGGLYYDDPIEVNQPVAQSCMWRYATGGWHNVWTSKGVAGTPTWSYVSIASGEYRLWWGFNGDMWTMKLRRQFQTPQQGAIVNVEEFDPDGYLETGQYDMNMRGFLKLGSHLEIYLRPESRGTVRVKYRTNFSLNQAWTTLGQATSPGRTVIAMPPVTDQPVSEGIPFIWIQFRIEMEQDRIARGLDTTGTPMMDSIVMKFTKIPLTGNSWSIKMPLSVANWNGENPAILFQKLNDLIVTPKFVPFVHKREVHRVLVAQLVGGQQTGDVPFSDVQISILEVGIPDSNTFPAYGASNDGGG